MNSYDLCPVCGQMYALRCKCFVGDRTCSQGHHWFICPVHNVIVIGESDHSKSTFSCHCEDYPENKIHSIIAYST
jgi:hypothetical protein